jgi:hypothetical protein
MGTINFHDATHFEVGPVGWTAGGGSAGLYYRDVKFRSAGEPIEVTVWSADPTRLMTADELELRQAAEAKQADDPSRLLQEIGGEG